MNPKSQKLLEGPVLKSLLLLAVPIVFANVLQSAYQLIDTFWVGRVGKEAIAAVSVSTPIIFLTMSLGIGFSIAGSTLIAQYAGAKNRQMVNHTAAQTLLIIIILSILLGGVGYIMTPRILQVMGVAPSVYHGAKGFMQVSFIALIFNFTFFMFQSIMRGVGEMKLPVIITISTVLLNFILDPLFIFGHGPIPELGVMGAALATVGTQGLAALAGIIVLMRGQFSVHVSLQNMKPDFVFLKKVLNLGMPSSIEMSMRGLSMTALIFLVASFGTVITAAYGVGSTLLMMIVIPAIGLSMAVSALVGQNIGAGNMKRAEQIGNLGSFIAFFSLTIVGIVVFVFAPNLVSIFAPNQPEVISMSAVFLRITALSWGFLGAQRSIVGVFRASGNMMTALKLTVMSQWIIQLPVAYVLSKYTFLNEKGIWWSFVATNILTFGVTYILYKRGDWKKVNLTKEKRLARDISEEVIIDR